MLRGGEFRRHDKRDGWLDDVVARHDDLERVRPAHTPVHRELDRYRRLIARLESRLTDDWVGWSAPLQRQHPWLTDDDRRVADVS